MRLDLDFIEHPKVRKLIKRSGYEGFYSLIKLFSITGKLYKNGVLKDCGIEDIEDLSNWNGNEGEFVETLLQVKLLDFENGVYQIHDWKHHQPWIYFSDTRSEKARIAAEARWNGKTDTENAHSMQDACGEHTECNAPSPTPTPTPNPNPKPKKDNIPPSLDEVEAYCKERKNGIDAQHFVAFYNAKGWMIGKNKMKDWKSAIITWEKNDKKDNPKKNDIHLAKSIFDGE
jgi:hypothetical protein